MKAVVVCLAACSMLASCLSIQYRSVEPFATQSKETPQDRGALSGQRQLIASFYATAPDCTSLGYPTLKLANRPQHGEVSVERGTQFAAFGEDDLRNVCRGQKVPATMVYYTSEPGFIGADSVVFERIGVAGAYGIHAYRINVR